jgi:hypothetical protein
MKFRTKQVEVEAVQILGPDFNHKRFDGCPFTSTPEWLKDALVHERLVPVTPNNTDYAEWELRLGGKVALMGTVGDWLVQDMNGGIRVVKDKDFLESFEPVV